MAEEVAIGGGPTTAKIRSIWAVALLPLVTIGIYYFVWYYKVNRELRDLGRQRQVAGFGDSPGKSLLAVTLGALIIVPAVISTINTYKRIRLAQQVVGVPPHDQINGWIVLIMYLVFSPAAYAYEQDALNKVWMIDSGRVQPGVSMSGAQPVYQSGAAVPVTAPPEAPHAPPIDDRTTTPPSDPPNTPA
jgi:hypothetical protein